LLRGDGEGNGEGVDEDGSTANEDDKEGEENGQSCINQDQYLELGCGMMRVA